MRNVTCLALLKLYPAQCAFQCTQIVLLLIFMKLWWRNSNYIPAVRSFPPCVSATVIPASDWSEVITCPGYWPLIGHWAGPMCDCDTEPRIQGHWRCIYRWQILLRHAGSERRRDNSQRKESVKYLSSEVLVDTKKGKIYSVISSIFSSVEIF